MPRLRLLFLAIAFSSMSLPAFASSARWFGADNPLSPRDSWGRLHQGPALDEADYAPREWWRLFYYNKSRYELMKDRAYVGALQRDLQRNGYYCGPIDGIYSQDVTDAIMHLQKNSNMRVTGSLTVAVRRALHLP
ncbi:MAG TPA: peptidoglycan-binding domain-containing protein [Chthoniobacterales bacterium]